MHHPSVDSHLQQACIEFVTNYNGSAYFEDLGLFLAEKCEVSFALIGFLTPENRNQVETVSLIAKGKVADKMVYPLHHTPCENVVGRNYCYYPTGVAGLFPLDKELHDLQIESYLGAPLFRQDGTPLGLIVLMNESIIRNAGIIESALRSITPDIQRRLEAHLNQHMPAMV